MSARDDLIRAARDTSDAVDTAMLESALTAYREAAARPVSAATQAPLARRHRVVRAVAATTLATKVVVGVATAAAVGGIGVAVTETVHHSPSPRPVVTSVPPRSPSPSGATSGPGSPTSEPSTATASPSTSDSITPSPDVSSTGPTGRPSTPPSGRPSTAQVSPSASPGASGTRSTSESPAVDSRGGNGAPGGNGANGGNGQGDDQQGDANT